MIIDVKNVPQEGQHLQAPQVFLHRPVQNLKEYIQKRTTELVFNLGEVAIWDWEDRKTSNIVVLASLGGQTRHYGISRNVKHILVIDCVLTTGKSPVPYIIPLCDFVLIQKQLKKHVVGFGTNLVLKLNLKPYVYISARTSF
jgi:hypothetical protein